VAEARSGRCVRKADSSNSAGCLATLSCGRTGGILAGSTASEALEKIGRFRCLRSTQESGYPAELELRRSSTVAPAVVSRILERNTPSQRRHIAGNSVSGRVALTVLLNQFRTWGVSLYLGVGSRHDYECWSGTPALSGAKRHHHPTSVDRDVKEEDAWCWDQVPRPQSVRC
jgi:hypothetical protein